MDPERAQFSAKLPHFFGPITEAPVCRVRDVIVCVTDASVESGPEEFRAHPPIASPHLLRETGSSEPVALGRGIVVDRLSKEDTELVMNACTPRGHYFAPIRQFGQRCSFVREVDRAEWEDQRLRWDADGLVRDALILSRLIRDHAYSTHYAARITDYDDGEQEVMYTPGAEGKHAYRLRRDRDWLDTPEGLELRDLLAAYWAVEGGLPERPRRAMWRAEYASWLKWGDLVLPTLISGLEALLKTDRHGSTAQFVRRTPALADDVGVEGVDSGLCERMYDARSAWVHGAHVRLFTTGQEAQDDAGATRGPQTEDQWSVFSEIARVQDVLRGAVRRCIEDDEFRATFTNDDLIRSRWVA